jgi:RNA polymerase sigma-70 factor, ECF subfamily
VQNYRRSRRRKGAAQPITSAVVDPEILADTRMDPQEQASRAQAGRILHKLLEELDEEKASVFVLAELEGMTVPAIAEAVGANVNTVYSRLRAARKQFEVALERLQAEEVNRNG